MIKILIVEDKKSLADMMYEYLREKYITDVAYTYNEALEKIENNSYNIILSDLRIGRASGLDLLKKIMPSNENLIFIILTAYGTIKESVEAMKNGAFDFIEKPVEFDYLDILLKKAIDQLEQKSAVQYTEFTNKQFLDMIIGESEKIQKVKTQIKKVFNLNIPVLISGETGTGKELVAKAIHGLSDRAKGPFVAINCSAIPKELIESELFGAEAGSYTGLNKNRIGKFEYANHGTLFLDEIGDMDFELQSKLLRCIEEQQFTRIGANKQISVNVRILSATNQNLRDLIKNGKFREDLYYRLNAFPIELPPLRERGKDIILLANYFSKEYANKINVELEGFSENAEKEMLAYSWPGNVRELKNVVERAVVIKNKAFIEAEDLNIKKAVVNNGEINCDDDFQGNLIDYLRDKSQNIEKNIIAGYLRKFKWNKKDTANALGISYRNLLQKIKDYELE